MDSRELRRSVLADLRRGAGFDAYAFVLTDPVTGVGSSPLADVPAMPRLPELIRLKYLTTYRRWTSLDRVARLADPAESLVWRELMAGYGVTDVASAVFRDRYGCWGFLDLWRRGGTYGDAELAAIDRRIDEVTARLRASQAATFAGPAGSAPDGPAVLLLDRDLRLRGQTPDSHEYLRELLPPGAIPAGAFNVAAQLLANEAGVSEAPPTARVHLHGGTWVSLRAAPLGDQIAVTIEELVGRDRLDLYARATGLSPRETELLALLADGSDTRAVAAKLYLSEHTVQDHLKSIFAKTGTNNRRALLARALGG